MILDIRLLSALAIGAAFTFRSILFQTDIQSSGIYTLGYSLSHVALAILIERRNPYNSLIISSIASLITYLFIFNQELIKAIIGPQISSTLNNVAIILFGITSAAVLIASTRLYIYEKDPNSYALPMGLGCLLAIVSFTAVSFNQQLIKVITPIYLILYLITACGISAKQLLLDQQTFKKHNQKDQFNITKIIKNTYNIYTNKHVVILSLNALSSGLMLFYTSPILCIRLSELDMYYNSTINLIILIAMAITLTLQDKIMRNICGTTILVSSNLLNPIIAILTRVYFRQLYNINTIIPLLIMATMCIIGVTGCNYTMATASRVVETEKTTAFALVNSATMLGSVVILIATYIINIILNKKIISEYLFNEIIFDSTTDLLLLTFLIIKAIAIIVYIAQRNDLEQQIKKISK